MGKQQERFSSQVPKPSYISLKDLGDIFKQKQKSYVEDIGTTNIDPDKYDFPMGTGVNTNFDKIRARAQGGGEQAWNAFKRTGLSILPEIIGTTAAMLDVPGYFSNEAASTNWLTESMNELKEGWIKDVTPIYRENPEEYFDVYDPAWWAEFGSTVGTSALAFAATGWATGVGVAKLGVAFTRLGSMIKGTKAAQKGIRSLEEAASTLTKAGELSKRGEVAGELLKAGNFIETYAPIAQTGANAYLMNHAEGVLEAGGSYDQVYNETLQKGFSPTIAHKEASMAAARSMEINNWNIILNLTGASHFTKAASRGAARKLFTNPAAMGIGKKLLLESGQEYLEETINAYAAKKVSADVSRKLLGLKTDPSNLDLDLMGDLITSAEGVEAGFWGAVGGAGQTSIVAGITNRKEASKAREIWKNHLEYAKELDDAAKDNGKGNFWTVTVAGEKIKELNLQKETLISILDKASPEEANQIEANIKEIDNRILFNQFLASASQGELAKLVRSYKEVTELEAEEAEKRGFEVDKSSREFYKTKAEDALTELATLENIYNRTQALESNSSVALPNDRESMFTNRVSKHIKEKRFIELTNKEDLIEGKINSLTNKLEALPKTKEGKLDKRYEKRRNSLVSQIQQLKEDNNYKEIIKAINSELEDMDSLDEEYFKGTTYSAQQEIRDFNKKINEKIKDAKRKKKATNKKKEAIAKKEEKKLTKEEREAQAAERQAKAIEEEEENKKKIIEEDKEEDKELKLEELKIADMAINTKEEKKLKKAAEQVFRDKKRRNRKERRNRKLGVFTRKLTKKTFGKTVESGPTISLATSIVNKEAGNNLLYGKSVEDKVNSITKRIANNRKGLHSLFDTISFRSRDFQIGENGEILEVTNNINDLGKELLNKGIFKEGTKITIEVDKDYDGDIRWSDGEMTSWKALRDGGKLTEEDKLDYTPIAIKHKGKTIGYISTVESLATRKLNPDYTNEITEITNLRELRAALLKLNKPFKTEINNTTVGSLFLDHNNKAESVNQHLIEGTKYGIYNGNNVSGVNLGTGVITNLDQIKESRGGDINGYVVALIPSYKKEGKQYYTASTLHRTTLTDELVNSAMQAIEIYNKSRANIPLTEKEEKIVDSIIKMQMGKKSPQGEPLAADQLDITEFLGLSYYLDSFLYVKSGEVDVNTYIAAGVSAPLSITKTGVVFYPVGSKDPVFGIDTLKDDSNKEKLKETLIGTYTNVNSTSFQQSSLKVPIIQEDGEVVDMNNGKSGIEFYKSNALLTNIRKTSIPGTDETTNFIQPVVTFDTNAIIQKTNTLPIEKTEEEKQEEINPKEETEIDQFARLLKQAEEAEKIKSSDMLTTEEILEVIDSDVVLSIFREIDPSGKMQDLFISNIASKVVGRLAGLEKITLTKKDLTTEHGQIGFEVDYAMGLIKGKLDKMIELTGKKHPYDALRNLGSVREQVNELVYQKVAANFESQSILKEIEGSETIDNEKIPDAEDSLKGGSYIEDSLTITTKMRMSLKLKQKLAFIPKSEKTLGDTSGANELFGGYFQNHEDLDLIINTLEGILAETFEGYNAITGSFNEMIKILEGYANEAPFMLEVIKRLKDFPKDNKLKNEFVSSMLKHYVQMRFIKMGKTKRGGAPYLNVLEDNANSTKQYIKTLWKEDLINSHLVEAKIVKDENENPKHIYTINEDVRKDLLNVLRPIVEAKKGETQELALRLSSEGLREILAIAGFPVHENVIKEIRQDPGYAIGKMSYVEQFKSKWGIFYQLYQVLVNEPINSNVFQGELVSGGFINSLATKEARYNKTFKSHTHTSGEKLISSYAEHKYITKRASRLKEDIGLLTDLANADFSKNSIWLKNLLQIEDGEFLRDEDDQVILKPVDSREVDDLLEVEYMGLNPFTTDSKNYDRLNIKELQKLKKEEYEIVKLALFLNKGMKKGLNKIRRSKILPATFSNKSTAVLLTIAAKEIRLSETGELEDNLIEDVYEAVFESEFSRMISENSPNLKENSYEQGKNLFYFIPELNDISELFDEETGFANPALLLEMPPVIKIKIKDAIRSHLTSLVNEKMTSWKDMGIISKEDTLVITDSVYVNETISKKVDTFKELSKIDKKKLMAKNVAADFVINYFLSNVNYHQLFAGDPALYHVSKEGDSKLDRIKRTRDNIGKRLAMEIAPGTMMAQFDNAVYKTFNTLFVNDKTSQSSVTQYLKDIGVHNNYFEDITATDGVELVTVEHYLTNRYLLGEIGLQEFQNYLKKENREGLDFNDLQILFSPQKPVTVGTRFDNGVEVKDYIKSAEFPLAKNFTRGNPNLEGIRKLMTTKLSSEMGPIADRLAFSSAVKVGLVANPLNLFDDNGNIVDISSISQETILKARKKFDRKDLTYQQKVPVKNNTVINAVSQATKLLFQNIGHIEGFKWKNNEVGITGDILKEHFDKAWGVLYEQSIYDLRKELGISEKNIENLDYWDIPLEKLSKLLKDEALARGYSIPDRASLEIDEKTSKFAMPLWAGGNARKIEALLNSLVSNRVFKQEMSGKSYVLSPELGGTQVIEGYENLSDKRGIVLDKDRFDVSKGLVASHKIGEGKDAYMTKNQVIVSWETSWGSMQNFIVNGEFQWDRFDKEILEGVGMRIPNQNHSSSASIEIVGFLPENVQNQIITPVDFVAQMGSDFDIDKLYVYWNNNHVKDGRVVKTTSENYLESTKSKKASYGIEKQIDAQNTIIDIHQAVLNNPNDEVQKENKEALDFFGLEEDALNYVENLSAEGIYSPFSEQYNSNKYFNATSGNDAISVFAVNNTLNARLQAAGRIEKNGIAEAITYQDFIEMPITFGRGYTSYGDISNSNVMNSSEKKSRFINALLSAAVDDEKEQLLWRLNITPTTRGVVSAMALLGFNKDTVLAFVNQPILLPKNNKRDYFKELETLIKTDENYAEYKDEEYFNKYLNEFLNQGEQELKDNHKKEDGSLDFLFSQIAVRIKFDRLNTMSNELVKLSNSLNLDTSRVGKDSFEALEKENIFLRHFNAEPKFNNVDKLFGEFKNLKEGTVSLPEFNKESGEMEKEYYSPPGYVKLPGQRGYFKPITREGYVYAYGLNSANKIWSQEDILPYNIPVVKSMLDKAMRLSYLNSNSRTSDIVNFRRTVFNNMKSYLLSDLEKMGLSKWNSQKFREQLLRTIQDKDGNILQTALSDYVHSMKADELFRKNAFLRNLNIRKDKENPNSLIAFVFTGANDITEDNTSFYIAAETLMLDKTPLSTPFIIDGVTIAETGADLYRLLVSSQYALGGLQQADEFIKLISIPYLKTIGAVDYLNTNVFKRFQTTTEGSTIGVINKNKNDNYLHPALIQMFQHFPDYLKTEKNVKERIIEESVKTHNGEIIRFKLEPEASEYGEGDAPFNTMITVNMTALTNASFNPNIPADIGIFKFNGDEYIRVESLKERGVRQYNTKEEVGRTLNPTKSLRLGAEGYADINNPTTITKHIKIVPKNTFNTIDSIWSKFRFNEGTTDAVLEGIRLNSKNEKEVALATVYQELFTDFTKDLPVIERDLGPYSLGRYYWTVTKETSNDIILINKNHKKFKDNPEELTKTYLHEHTHALTNKIIDLIEKDGGTKRQERAVKGIKEAFEMYKKNIPSKASYEIKYAKKNLAEFIAGVMTEPEVRAILNNIKSTREQSLLDYVISKFLALFRAFGIESGTLAHDALEDILALMHATTVEHNSVEIELIEKNTSEDENILVEPTEDEEIKKLPPGFTLEEGGPNIADSQVSINREDVNEIFRLNPQLHNLGTPTDFITFVDFTGSKNLKEFESYMYVKGETVPLAGIPNITKFIENLPTKSEKSISNPLIKNLTKRFNSKEKAYQYYSLLKTPLYKNWAFKNKESLAPTIKVFNKFIQEAIIKPEIRRMEILENASPKYANAEVAEDETGEVITIEEILNKKPLGINPIAEQVTSAKQQALKRYRKRTAILEGKINESTNIQARKRMKGVLKSLQQESDILFEELIELQKTSNIHTIHSMMERELNWVEEAINTDINLFKKEALADINMAEDVLVAWGKTIELLNKIETDTALIDELFNQTRIERLLNKIKEKQAVLVVEMTKERSGLTNEDAAIRTIYHPVKDTTKAAAYLRDASGSRHIIIQHMQGRISEANRKAHQDMQDLFSGEFEEIEKNARNKLAELGRDWDIFFAKDEKGRMKDKIVSPLSDKYINQEWYKNPYKSEGGKEIAYNEWFLRSHIMINPEKAMYDREAYEEELNKQIPSKHAVAVAMDEAIRKYEKYQLLREEQEIALIEKYDDPKQRKNIINAWARAHNPIEVAKDKSGVIQLKTKSKAKKLKFSQGLPLPERGGKSTEYYDTDFAELEKHEELLAFQSKFVDIMHNLNMLIPGKINKNFTIPLFQQALLGAWQGSDVKATGRAYQDKLINTLRGTDIIDDILIEENTKGEKQLSTSFFSKSQRKIERFKELEYQKWELENPNKIMTKMEKRALTNIAVDKVVQESSQDVGKNLKMFAALVLTYKHKAEIETEIALADKVFKDKVKKAKKSKGKLVYRDKEGELTTSPEDIENAVPLAEEDAKLENELIRLDALVDTFYGVPKEKGGEIDVKSVKLPKWLGGKTLIAYTTEEKALLEEYEEIDAKIDVTRQLLQDKVALGQITESEASKQFIKLDKDQKEIEEKIESTGGNFTGGGIVNALMQWVQLKALGWNLTSSFANIGFGVLTNNIEAAGEQFYTQKAMNKGYSLIKYSFAKTFGGGGNIAIKTRNLMDENNVLKKPSEEFFEIKGERKGLKKYYNPYVFTDMTEYLNQGPVMIAVLDTLKITTKKGEEISIWDAYDEVGEWKTEVGNKIDYQDELMTAANQIDKAIRNNHGNYDNYSSPIAIKRSAYTKMATQFRTWMFEGLFTRFGEEQVDYEMDITRKGRWRTYWDLGFAESSKQLANLIKRQDISKDLSAVDEANLKKNLREMRNYALLTGTYLLLTMLAKAIKGEDDDEESLGWKLPLYALYNLINLTSRVQTDILLYINPSEFKKITGKDLIPITTIFTDIERLRYATYKLMIGEDILKTGPYKGRSRWLRDFLKGTPGGASLYKIINNSNQILNKQKTIVEDILEENEKRRR